MEKTTNEAGLAGRFRAFLAAVEACASNEELTAYFTPDAIFCELPNLICPNGATRDLPALLASAERGRQVIENQRFVVRDLLIDGERLAARIEWSGTLKVAAAGRPRGSQLSAFIAGFARFRDGRIAEYSTYDCYPAS